VLRLYLRPRIPRAFRERLMLTVTAVNACRYCAAFHRRTAGRLGVPHEEAALLLEGEVAGPPREVPALLYARHWAEADARPDPAERARLLAGYAPEEIAQVEAAIRLIRIGNLAGNALDRAWRRVSGRERGATPG
jgi:AhpD family alkylhydroperoxidase